MLISGAVPFSNKKEKKKIFKQLRQEYGSRVEILFENKLITYKCHVSRKKIF